MGSVLVICEIKDCGYHIVKPDAGSAYKNQCGNDEIEIGLNINGKPECFSYEKMRERDDPI